MPVALFGSSLPVSAATAFAWHARIGALERLIPPDQNVSLESRLGTIHDGDRTVLCLHVGPFTRRWVAVHQDFKPDASFTDVQESGPFARWEHTHAFVPNGDQCTLEDRITWELPWWVPRWVERHVERTITKQFAWRHRRTIQDLTRHAAGDPTPLTIAVSGASGLVGSALIPLLTTGGHQVRRLVRHEPSRDDDRAIDSPQACAGCDAVIHLAGAGIADRRWSPARKAELRASRVDSTARLCTALAALPQPPKVLLCASAVGWYGTQGIPADEDVAAGDGFLAELCQAWEAACAPARNAGIRVVHLRFGMVLAAHGGALAKLLPVFRLGLGGRLGDGRQAMPWIGLDDALGAILHLLHHHDAAGPFNLVAPEMTTNLQFTRVLAKALHRPAFLPVPAAAIRLGFGELGDQVMLHGRAAIPRRLTESGFTWITPALAECLRWELGL